MSWLSANAVPLLLLSIPLFGLIKGLPVYELFIEGAEEGARLTVRILPYVIAMLLAVGVFRSSGCMAQVAEWLSPIMSKLGVPVSVLPLALMRPLSGSGSLALAADILYSEGPDSFAGVLASVMQGATDTTVYVLAVYFGSVGVTKFRYALFLGLSADVVSMLSACIFCRLFF